MSKTEILEIFQCFDEHGDGQIQISELASVLQSLDPLTWDDDKIQRLFNAMDADRNRRIDYHEFIDFVYGHRWRPQQSKFRDTLGKLNPGGSRPEEEDLQQQAEADKRTTHANFGPDSCKVPSRRMREHIDEMFRQVDLNRDEKITEEELKEVAVGCGFTSYDAQKFFVQADLNKDGIIDHAEFFSWVFHEQAPEEMRLALAAQVEFALAEKKLYYGHPIYQSGPLWDIKFFGGLVTFWTSDMAIMLPVWEAVSRLIGYIPTHRGSSRWRPPIGPEDISRICGDIKRIKDGLRQLAEARNGAEFLEPWGHSLECMRDDLAFIENLMNSEETAKSFVPEEYRKLLEQHLPEASLAEASEAKADCEKVAAAMSAYESVVEALSKLSRGDVGEVRAMKTPPHGVVLTAHAICILFEVKPLKVRAADGTRVLDYWEAAKKELLADPRLVDKMIHYEIDSIPEKVFNKLEPLYNDPEFEPDKIKNVSVAAMGFCKWVRAIVDITESGGKTVVAPPAGASVLKPATRAALEATELLCIWLREIVKEMRRRTVFFVATVAIVDGMAHCTNMAGEMILSPRPVDMLTLGGVKIAISEAISEANVQLVSTAGVSLEMADSSLVAAVVDSQGSDDAM